MGLIQRKLYPKTLFYEATSTNIKRISQAFAYNNNNNNLMNALIGPYKS